MSAADYFQLDVLQAYRDFDQRPTRTNAVQFAVAAWHVQDRLRQEKGNPSGFVQGLFANCPELDLVRRLANVGKHDQLRNPAEQVLLKGAEGGGILEGFGPHGTTSVVDRGSLTLKEANGTEHDVRELFRRVINFWKSQL